MSVRVISTRIALDGEKQFKRQMGEVNSELKTLKSEMALVDAQFKGQANTTEALTAKGRVLQQQLSQQQEKVRALEQAVADASRAYGENDKRVDNLRQSLNYAKVSLTSLNDAIDDNERYLDEARSSADGCARSIDGYGKAVKDAGDDTEDFGHSLRDAFTTGAVSGAVQSLIGELDALIERTTEYRRIMGSLEQSSKLAGYSADETTEIYRQLYGVLGDDQTAATTTANLQALGLSQDKLRQITDLTIGTWAKYGDSIPIDGLAESINETIQVAKVTGTFADALNWAGISEDEFNVKLEACGSKSERVNLVLQALAGQGLADAAAGWRESNQALVDANLATADGMEVMARYAELVEPLFTAVKEAVIGAAGGLLDLIESGDPAIYVLEGLAIAAGALALAMGMNTIIEGCANAIVKMDKAASLLNTTLKANPLVLVISLLAGLAAAFITAYQTNDEFRAKVDKAFADVGKFVGNAVERIKTFFTHDIPEAISNALAWLTSIPEKMRTVGADLLMGLWAGIGDKVEWLKGKVAGVVDTIKGWFTSKDGFDEHSPSKWSYSVASYLMDGLALGMEDSKGQVMETVDDVVNEMKDRLQGVYDVLNGHKEVIDLQYQLWERTDGANASDAEKYAVKLAMLSQQEQMQAEIVDAAAAAYDAVVALYGEASEQSYEYQKQLLQEQLKFADLLDSINEVREAQAALAAELPVESGTIRAVSAPLPVTAAVTEKTVYRAASGIVTGVTDGGKPAETKISVTVPLSVNGREFARATIDDIRAENKSNPEVQSDTADR